MVGKSAIAYEELKSKIQYLGYEETLYVIWSYANTLQTRNFKIPPGIQMPVNVQDSSKKLGVVAPWELELLVKETVMNGRTNGEFHATIREWAQFKEIISKLRKLENEIYSEFGLEEEVMFEMSRIAHRQFNWQENSPSSTDIIRSKRIFDTSLIDQICFDTLGLTVDKIFSCGIALYSMLIGAPAINVPISSEIAKISPDDLSKFLTWSSTKFHILKRWFSDSHRVDDTYAYAFSPLRNTPLIEMVYNGHNAIACPIPTLLYWKICSGLYYSLLNDTRFPNAFGDSFQSYVGTMLSEQLPNSVCDVIAEARYGSKKKPKDTVDWILKTEGAAIFVECKAKRITWNAKLDTSRGGALELQIDEMAKSVVQVYKTMEDYKENLWPQLHYDPELVTFPVVVTLEKWHFMGGPTQEILDEKIRERISDFNIDPAVLKDSPYSVMSIEELETVSQVMRKVEPSAVLRSKLDDNEMSKWAWSTFVKSEYRRYLPKKPLYQKELRGLLRDIAETQKSPQTK